MNNTKYVENPIEIKEENKEKLIKILVRKYIERKI